MLAEIETHHSRQCFQSYCLILVSLCDFWHQQPCHIESNLNHLSKAWFELECTYAKTVDCERTTAQSLTGLLLKTTAEWWSLGQNQAQNYENPLG